MSRFAMKSSSTDGRPVSLTGTSLARSAAGGAAWTPTCGYLGAYVHRFGFRAFKMLNLFAYRATDPRVLRTAADIRSIPIFKSSGEPPEPTGKGKKLAGPFAGTPAGPRHYG